MVKEVRSSDQVQDTKHIDLISICSANDKELSKKIVRILGSVYTPPNYAQFLTSWAIQYPKDKVLDVGIGEGAFTFAAYRRLIELGATVADAQIQLFGAEISASTYNKFCELARSSNVCFSNLKNADFFDIDFPPVDAIVGNPPYVRRTYLKNVDEIRRSVIESNLPVGELNITRMTDLYIYFLLRALPMLKPGGRLAVITSDPWLNVSYGEEFKRYLQEHFKIETLITLDQRVFEDAQVKPVLILATKKEVIDRNWYIQFIRLKNNLSVNNLQQLLNNHNKENADITCLEVRNGDLKAFTPWGIHFKAPQVYGELVSHRLMTQIVNLAETRIGIQTLAKEFFVLTPEQAKSNNIEKEFLEPLAQSIRYIREPVISTATNVPFYLFYCAKSKEELQGTHALTYILQGERAEVEVRGKDITVIGYHSKERIQRSNRRFWYDLQSSLERRGRASILIPRLVYRTFRVVWNKVKFVPGELFIEFLPPSGIDIEVYLAVLTSSISEIMLRVHAQVYGGGTYNIGPGEIKQVPILNIEILTRQQKEALKQSYLLYISDKNHDRSAIDIAMCNILGFSDRERQNLKEVLEDLLLIATSAKKSPSV